MKRLIVIALLVVGCGGSAASASVPSATPVPSPAAVTAWPTVLELREALAAEGYELIKDITNDGWIRWRGPDINAPIEILGKDTDRAKVSVTIDIEPGHDTHLENVLAHFPQVTYSVVTTSVAQVREEMPNAPAFESTEVIRPTTGGEVEVSGFPTGPPIYVFINPK